MRSDVGRELFQILKTFSITHDEWWAKSELDRALIREQWREQFEED